jgi:hypothetical protein
MGKRGLGWSARRWRRRKLTYGRWDLHCDHCLNNNSDGDNDGEGQRQPKTAKVAQHLGTLYVVEVTRAIGRDAMKRAKEMWVRPTFITEHGRWREERNSRKTCLWNNCDESDDGELISTRDTRWVHAVALSSPCSDNGGPFHPSISALTASLGSFSSFKAAMRGLSVIFLVANRPCACSLSHTIEPTLPHRVVSVLEREV